jgi:hypothetical protein
VWVALSSFQHCLHSNVHLCLYCGSFFQNYLQETKMGKHIMFIILITFIIVRDKEALFSIILSHFQCQTICRVQFMHIQLCAFVFMQFIMLLQCLNPNIFIFLKKSYKYSKYSIFIIFIQILFSHLEIDTDQKFDKCWFSLPCQLPVYCLTTRWRFLKFYRFLQGWALMGRFWSFTTSPDIVMASTSV